MVDLTKYATPADRLSDCSLYELGGVLTGSNYFEKNLEGTETYSSELTIIVPFKPGFNWNENVVRTLYDLGNYPTNTVYCYKLNTAGNYRLDVQFKSLVFAIPSTSYSSYWLTNQWNLLTITIKANQFYCKLNDNLIGSSLSFSYTPIKSTIARIGCAGTGTYKFLGEISWVKTFKRILSDKELTDIWYNRTYNYRNEATLDLPMTSRLHDPPYTYDVSKSQKTATLVDAPIKNTILSGYRLNGTSQYITVPGVNIYNTPETTIICKFTPFFAADSGTNEFICDSSDSSRYALYKSAGNNLVVYMGNSVLFSVDVSIFKPCWTYNGINTLIITSKENDNNLYLNNKLLANNTTAWISKNPAEIQIGTAYLKTAAYDFYGIIHQFTIIPKMLTPLQVADIYLTSTRDSI